MVVDLAHDSAHWGISAPIKFERRSKVVFLVEALWRDQVMRVVPDIVCNIDIDPVQQLVEALGEPLRNHDAFCV